MKKSKILLVLLFGMFIVFSSCEKKSLIDTENNVLKNEIVKTDQIQEDNLKNNTYILNGKTIIENDIDYNNNNLRLVYGYGKDVYVFYSDNDMYNWAIKIKGLEKFAQSIKNIEKARINADKMSPKEFDKWLSNNYNTGQKSGGVGYHGNNFRIPSFILLPVPRSMVAFKDDDKLSSFKAFVNSYIFFNDYKFKGRAIAYITIGYRQKRRLPNGYNDTMSSYWPF
ncbi:MAG: hypothetical protein DRI94_12105 [Bacteroidetes bacterium]|nr:MAG: hypothetical protein DRI94_12105 [Bacteroidota bacterium]